MKFVISLCNPIADKSSTLMNEFYVLELDFNFGVGFLNVAHDVESDLGLNQR